VRFFLSGVAQTAAKGRDVFQQILALRGRVEQSVMTLGKGAPLALRALQFLYRKPVVDAAEIVLGLGISTPTANKLIKALVERGVLVEVTGQQRGRVYAFDPYLKLFIS